jgi:uncharacterized RDD family membrane protein YckC
MEYEGKVTGFWIRFAAAWIDVLLVSIIYITVFLLAELAGLKDYIVEFILQVAVGVFYYCYLQWKFKGTPGKRILSIQVLDTSFHQAEFRQFILRYFVSWFSAMVFFLGYIWHLFSEKKQTWHDMAAGTIVVYDSAVDCPMAEEKSSPTKVLLPIFLLLFIIVAGSGYYIYNNFNDLILPVVKEGEKEKNEGKEFGKDKDYAQCTLEALGRNKDCGGGFTCELSARMFLDACLDASTKINGVCNNVPDTTEIMDSVTWRLSECQRLFMDNTESCGRILSELQKKCHNE